MSPEKLMDTIGGISDRYIAEAAKKNCMKDFFCAGLIELAGGLIAGVFAYRKWSFTLLSLCLCLLLLGTKNIVKWARGNGCGTWSLVGKIILPVFWAFLILLAAILIGTRIRVITVGSRNIGLIEKPCENGSGSARRDILQSLKEKGLLRRFWKYRISAQTEREITICVAAQKTTERKQSITVLTKKIRGCGPICRERKPSDEADGIVKFL